MLRISRSGGYVWYLATRVNGRSRRIKIGIYPILSLTDARERAREIQRDNQLGRITSVSGASAIKQSPGLSDRLSGATHMREGQIVEDEVKIAEFVANAVEALQGLLASFHMAREAVVIALQENIYSEMMDAFVTRTFEDIDILAAKGYEVDFISDVQVVVETISCRELALRVDGVAPVTLHYGKGDDAAEIGHEFPFSMKMRAPVAEPTALQYVDSHFDDSGWFQ